MDTDWTSDWTPPSQNLPQISDQTLAAVRALPGERPGVTATPSPRSRALGPTGDVSRDRSGRKRETEGPEVERT